MAHPMPTPKGNNTSSDVGGGSLLPPPMNQDAKGISFKSRITSTERVNTIIASTASTVLKIIPPYGQRQHYFPQHPEDFGEGGAFPEFHVPQYPLGMGLIRQSSGYGSGVVALTMDGQDGGRLQYEILAKQGHDQARIVYARPQDIQGRSIGEDEIFTRPSEEEIQKITENTQMAIENIVKIRVAATKPKEVQCGNSNETFIRYVSREAQDRAVEAANGKSSSAVVLNGGERIIKVVEAKVDPLEPAKFKHKKVAPLGGSPPAPVLHSPPRKATAEDQKAWYVPPSISNWKNPKGYTIPLDKRLASDGRGLQERVVNEKFATFAESLYIAENYAREEISARNNLEKKLMEKERREKEEQLRSLAEKARQSRYPQRQREYPMEHEFREEIVDSDSQTLHTKKTGMTSGTSIHHRFDSFEEREKIRKERVLEREKEYRLSHMGTERRHAHDNLTHERDISEKVALGLNVSIAGGNSDASTQFDLRLFHKGSASSGLASGFHVGQDETYNIYDKPLFQGSNAAQLLYHRPSKRDWDDLEGGNQEDEERPESERETIGKVRAFADSRSAVEKTTSTSSSGPIQFEKLETSTLGEKEDIFGLDQFLEDAKRGRR